MEPDPQLGLAGLETHAIPRRGYTSLRKGLLRKLTHEG